MKVPGFTAENSLSETARVRRTRSGRRRLRPRVRGRAGIIKEFTGVSDPYEVPADAEVTIDTREVTPQQAAQQIILHLEKDGYIGPEPG
jgi:Adenylylsulphate kinase